MQYQYAAAGVAINWQMTGGNRPPCPAGGRASPYIETNILRLAPLGIYETIQGPAGRRRKDMSEVNGYGLLGFCCAGHTGGCLVQLLAA